MPGFLSSTGTPGRDSRLRRSYCDPPGGVIVREHLQLWPRRDGLRPLALSTIMACKHVLPVMRRSNQGRLSTSRGGLGALGGDPQDGQRQHPGQPASRRRQAWRCATCGSNGGIASVSTSPMSHGTESLDPRQTSRHQAQLVRDAPIIAGHHPTAASGLSGS